MPTKSELTTRVKEEIERCGLGELSKTVGVSKSYLSMYASGKYQRDWRELEAKLRIAFAHQQLSFRDQRRLSQIEEILSNADNRSTILEALAITFG